MHTMKGRKTVRPLCRNRLPILKAILQKFSPKLQIKLKLLDCEGLFSVTSLREKDVTILERMKEEQILDVLRRLEQTLRRDRTKSGRTTLSRLLGTCKAKEASHKNSPVSIFLGDYVATLFLMSGVRPELLFEKMDHSGDGFLSFEEMSKGFQRLSGEIQIIKMTKAEVQIMHFMLDADGDGDLSFKEVKSWLDNAEHSRKVSYRVFRAAMEELGFGELRENMLKNLYVASVDGKAHGEIDFGRMYEVLHTTDKNG